MSTEAQAPTGPEDQNKKEPDIVLEDQNKKEPDIVLDIVWTSELIETAMVSRTDNSPKFKRHGEVVSPKGGKTIAIEVVGTKRQFAASSPTKVEGILGAEPKEPGKKRELYFQPHVGKSSSDAADFF